MAADGAVTHLSNKVTSLPMMEHDIVRVITPGAGGYGDPLNRDIQKVLQDVIECKVSVEGARRDYGVVIIGNEYDGYQIDEGATEAMRQELRR